MNTIRATTVIGGLLGCLLGVLFGTGGYTFYYAEGASYLSDDPRACVNCHIMREQYDGWQKASHHAVATCNDCHVPHDFVGKWLTKVSNGLHHSRSFTFQDFHEPIQIRPANVEVLNRNCVYCHSELTSEIRNVAYLQPARMHAETGPMDCVRCHDAVGHGPCR
jgi:cytochrome c nitrite reductase small subunit